MIHSLHNKSTGTGQSVTVQLGNPTTADANHSLFRLPFSNRTMKLGYGDKGNNVTLSGSDLVATKNTVDTSYGSVKATIAEARADRRQVSR